MDRAVVALVSPDVSLEAAFQRFHHGMRAIVVDAPAGRRLLMADELTEAWNKIADAGGDPAATPVGSIRPPAPSRRRPTPRRPILHRLRTTVRQRLAERFGPTAAIEALRLLSDALPPLSLAERSRFDSAFQGTEHQYTIQDAGDGAAVVVTSSEGFGGGLRSFGGATRFCTCVGNPVHRFEERELDKPGFCNKPHGVKVTCRAVDAT